MKWAFLFKFIFCGMMLELRMFQKVFFYNFLREIVGTQKISKRYFFGISVGMLFEFEHFQRGFF